MCLTLEFDPDADTVSGRIRSGLGADERFCGWMALTRAIELALAGAEGRDDDMGATADEI